MELELVARKNKKYVKKFDFRVDAKMPLYGLYGPLFGHERRPNGTTRKNKTDVWTQKCYSIVSMGNYLARKVTIYSNGL